MLVCEVMYDALLMWKHGNVYWSHSLGTVICLEMIDKIKIAYNLSFSLPKC